MCSLARRITRCKERKSLIGLVMNWRVKCNRKDAYDKCQLQNSSENQAECNNNLKKMDKYPGYRLNKNKLVLKQKDHRTPMGCIIGCREM